MRPPAVPKRPSTTQTMLSSLPLPLTYIDSTSSVREEGGDDAAEEESDDTYDLFASRLQLEGGDEDTSEDASEPTPAVAAANRDEEGAKGGSGKPTPGSSAAGALPDYYPDGTLKLMAG